MIDQWIVVEGNPSDGFAFFGPFDSTEEATEFAEQLGGSWWIVHLTKDI